MAFPSGPISIGVTSVVRNGEVVTIQFSDGVGLEVNGWDDFVSTVESRLGEINTDFVRWFALARWIIRNPTGANPNQLTGKTATLNLGAANIANILSVV